LNLTRFQELLAYPSRNWDEPASTRWFSLCTRMRDYEAPSKQLAISKKRKWEVISAFQKSIRRGDKLMALRLISAMDEMPEEYGYFWKRLCVIACEDIGPADDLLATFVAACEAERASVRSVSARLAAFADDGSRCSGAWDRRSNPGGSAASVLR